ncbi:MAG TPA: hemerythrin family protein [Geobacteraceae bacterium]|nr:hemerythrin family protein [Geobacteraceae bacterium]
MSITWNNNLLTGVELIDSQHKELFSRFDSLVAACNQGKGRDEVMRLLQFLDDYIREHFAAEEQLQIRHNYPQYGEHKAQHISFVADVDQLKNQFLAEGATLPLVIQTNQALVNWLIRHISSVDLAFARYLKERAVS